MKILLAEYSVCAGIGSLAGEGRAMAGTLRRSFEAEGCTVLTPRDFGAGLAGLAGRCDAFLLIAPDDILGQHTEMLEAHCTNLGCPAGVVRLCADKLRTTEALRSNGIPAPRIVQGEGVRCVVKPRFGCGAEGVFIAPGPVDREGFISTEYVEGEHLSVSLVGGETMLPLTLNRQHIRTARADGVDVVGYDGNEVPYAHPAEREIVGTAVEAGRILGCRGLFGVDVVYGDRPYVVDVNPRPTTAVLALDRVLDASIAGLILQARFGTLPDRVGTRGRYAFTKADLEGSP